MKKLEVLDILSLIKEIGCCNMLDRNSLIHTLRSADENEAASYLENLTSKDFLLLMSKDFSDYLKN